MEVIQNRLNDRFVKFLFAPKHKSLLIAFLNDVLADIPANAERLPAIVDIEYADRETTPEHERDKMPRFDIIARTEDGRLFHVEIQLVGYENIIPRTLNYASRDYSGLTEKGEDYSSKRVICIVVADFLLFDDTPSYHTLHRILNVENGAWHMRGMEFHFIEVPKLRELHRWPVTGLERILYYLGSMGGEKEMQALEAEDTRVADMRQLERIFRSDPDLVREYQQREQDKLDYRLSLEEREKRGEARGITIGRNEGITIGRNEGISIGRNEGISIGRNQERKIIMDRLIATGMSPSQAASLTGMNA